MNYQLPQRAIKNILRKELEDRKTMLMQILSNNYVNDSCKEMIYLAYTQELEVLEKCNQYSDLEDFISFAGYRMSLEDWINSL